MSYSYGTSQGMATQTLTAEDLPLDTGRANIHGVPTGRDIGLSTFQTLNNASSEAPSRYGFPQNDQMEAQQLEVATDHVAPEC